MLNSRLYADDDLDYQRSVAEKYMQEVRERVLEDLSKLEIAALDENLSEFMYQLRQDNEDRYIETYYD